MPFIRTILGRGNQVAEAMSQEEYVALVRKVVGETIPSRRYYNFLYAILSIVELRWECLKNGKKSEILIRKVCQRITINYDRWSALTGKPKLYDCGDRAFNQTYYKGINSIDPDEFYLVIRRSALSILAEEDMKHKHT